MRQRSFFRSVLPVLAAIVAICFAIVVLLVSIYNPDRKTLAIELIKGLVQIATVLVAGQIINIVVKDREAARANAAALAGFQKEILERLSHAATSVRRRRRLLRAHALTRPYSDGSAAGITLLRPAYEEHMRALSDVQLDLDELRYELDALPQQFAEKEPIRQNANFMKTYLRRLLRQYENVLPTLEGDRLDLATFAVVDGEDIPLTDFVGPRPTSRFRSEFESAYRDAVKLLRQALLANKQ